MNYGKELVMNLSISIWKSKFLSEPDFKVLLDFFGGEKVISKCYWCNMQARESIMEFSPWAEELTTLLESKISNEIGRVVSVGDETAHVYGMNKNQS